MLDKFHMVVKWNPCKFTNLAGQELFACAKMLENHIREVNSMLPKNAGRVRNDTRNMMAVIWDIMPSGFFRFFFVLGLLPVHYCYCHDGWQMAQLV